MIPNRTSAQLRSHAQKYVIKLCKKYDIEIKSRRKSKFISRHLNYPYRRKNKKFIFPIEKISENDLFILKNFNFYDKSINLRTLEIKPEEQIINFESNINKDPEDPNKKNLYFQTKEISFCLDNNIIKENSNNISFNRFEGKNYKKFFDFINYKKTKIINFHLNDDKILGTSNTFDIENDIWKINPEISYFNKNINAPIKRLEKDIFDTDVFRNIENEINYRQSNFPKIISNYKKEFDFIEKNL